VCEDSAVAVGDRVRLTWQHWTEARQRGTATVKADSPAYRSHRFVTITPDNPDHQTSEPFAVCNVVKVGEAV